jgi:integrase
MREGELVGMQAKDFNAHTETLRISRTVYISVEGTPKSKRGRRTIKLPKMAYEALSDHVERGNGSVWMFPNSVGKPMWRYSFIDFGWKPLLKRARGEYNLTYAVSYILPVPHRSTNYSAYTDSHHTSKLHARFP